MNRLINYLSLNKVGAFEIFLALFPILSGYSWGVLRGNLVFLVPLAIWALFKRKVNMNMKWLSALIIFVTIHELLLMCVIPVRSYFINNTISLLIICISIYPIAKAVDYKKFVGAINWIAIMNIGGLVYQFSMIQKGMTVSPIGIPFLPEMETTSRLYEISIRPSSFFWEPAALVTFLMIPLFISLSERKFIWSIVLVLAMFLSTSSTGIFMSMCMLCVFILTQKVNFWTRALVVLIGISLFYCLINSTYFEAGVDKIENTDPEKNARLMNGIFLYDAMSHDDVIFGIQAANVDEFHERRGGHFFGYGSVFVPTFWLTLAKYGVIGLALYLMVYLYVLWKDKTTLPYILVLIISMFFQVASIIGSSLFAFQLIFLYSFISRAKLKSRLSNHQ